MPVNRAILHDIHELGLNPKVAHVLAKDGRLRDPQEGNVWQPPAVVTLQPAAPEPVAVEPTVDVPQVLESVSQAEAKPIQTEDEVVQLKADVEASTEAAQADASETTVVASSKKSKKAKAEKPVS